MLIEHILKYELRIFAERFDNEKLENRKVFAHRPASTVTDDSMFGGGIYWSPVFWSQP